LDSTQIKQLKFWDDRKTEIIVLAARGCVNWSLTPMTQQQTQKPASLLAFSGPFAAKLCCIEMWPQPH